MSETSASTTWLTQEAYDRLKAEFEDRSGPVRDDIIKKIEAAREEGDLKENGGYHAAKEEQGKNEARVRQLRALLENAEVGVTPPDDGLVEAGMVVTIKFPGDDDTVTFLLGHREANTGSDIEVYSVTSPLGTAVNGKSAGDSVTYQLPNGKEITVEIVEAKPYQG